MKVDGTRIVVNGIFNDEENIYIMYKYTSFIGGDRFGEYAMSFFDDSGKEYVGYMSNGTRIIGGGRGVITLINTVPEDTEYVTLKIDWYDRKDEVKIWLKEEEKANES
ncbi:MAG: hypothetical protein RR844_03360 [Clostridium sp.]